MPAAASLERCRNHGAPCCPKPPFVLDACLTPTSSWVIDNPPRCCTTASGCSSYAGTHPGGRRGVRWWVPGEPQSLAVTRCPMCWCSVARRTWSLARIAGGLRARLARRAGSVDRAASALAVRGTLQLTAIAACCAPGDRRCAADAVRLTALRAEDGGRTEIGGCRGGRWCPASYCSTSPMLTQLRNYLQSKECMRRGDLRRPGRGTAGGGAPGSGPCWWRRSHEWAKRGGTPMSVRLADVIDDCWTKATRRGSRRVRWVWCAATDDVVDSR